MKNVFKLSRNKPNCLFTVSTWMINKNAQTKVQDSFKLALKTCESSKYFECNAENRIICLKQSVYELILFWFSSILYLLHHMISPLLPASFWNNLFCLRRRCLIRKEVFTHTRIEPWHVEVHECLSIYDIARRDQPTSCVE